MANLVLARIQPVDFRATKNVFISAVRYATSMGSPCLPFDDELRVSAQEQVDFMLSADDKDISLVTTDEEVKLESKKGLLNLFSLFQLNLSSLLAQTDGDSSENRVMQSLSDLGWICNVLSKIDLMKDFVDLWVDLSAHILETLEDKKVKTNMCDLILKVIEITGKALDAVGYGNVIIPPARRVKLLRMWLPYIRKTKAELDSIGNEKTGFPYKMDEDLCQSVEGAIVAVISALPSNDQAEILAEWMSGEEMRYPDLSEAFEVWCYRSKSAKRRLVEAQGLKSIGEATVTL